MRGPGERSGYTWKSTTARKAPCSETPTTSLALVMSGNDSISWYAGARRITSGMRRWAVSWMRHAGIGCPSPRRICVRSPAAL